MKMARFVTVDIYPQASQLEIQHNRYAP